MTRLESLLLFALLPPATALAIDNDYVRITRDAAPCASGSVPGCGERVIVALGDIELASGGSRRSLSRGDVAVFGANESYAAPTGGSYFEVAIKPDHPPSDSPGESIAPEKNAILYESAHFFIFEERLAPGDTRPRHSHSQRVVIQLNPSRLRQWPDGKPDMVVNTVPERPSFSPPVIHVVENIGEVPLRGVVIEFKPGQPGPARR
jgi:quercetin dioxygenase-like cupin family protein